MIDYALLKIIKRTAPSSTEPGAAAYNAQVITSGGHRGCLGQDCDIGGSADLTRAIRAYRDLLPCAGRGDIPLTQRTPLQCPLWVKSGHWRRYFLGVIGVERATWSSIARSKLMRLSNNAKS
jgi:hypothetical protein